MCGSPEGTTYRNSSFLIHLSLGKPKKKKKDLSHVHSVTLPVFVYFERRERSIFRRTDKNKWTATRTIVSGDKTRSTMEKKKKNTRKKRERERKEKRE